MCLSNAGRKTQRSLKPVHDILANISDDEGLVNRKDVILFQNYTYRMNNILHYIPCKIPNN